MELRPFANKIVLHSIDGYTEALDALVAQFIHDGVALVAVVGDDCEKIEDIIDELCVGDGSRPNEMTTTSHPGETVEEVLAFANSFTGKLSGEAQVVAWP